MLEKPFVKWTEAPWMERELLLNKQEDQIQAEEADGEGIGMTEEEEGVEEEEIEIGMIEDPQEKEDASTVEKTDTGLEIVLMKMAGVSIVEEADT